MSIVATDTDGNTHHPSKKWGAYGIQPSFVGIRPFHVMRPMERGRRGLLSKKGDLAQVPLCYLSMKTVKFIEIRNVTPLCEY